MNMRKDNRKPPPGIFELGEDLLLSFRMCGVEVGNVCHSRRALPTWREQALVKLCRASRRHGEEYESI